MHRTAEALTAGPLQEADVLSTLNHPNVVAYFEHFQTEDEVVLVQELCEGVPLEKKLGHAMGAGLGEREAIAVLWQMLCAVQHCHQKGFVHRDLKADNFVFASHGPATELKLIDFGLASRCGRDEQLAGHAGSVVFIAR